MVLHTFCLLCTLWLARVSTAQVATDDYYSNKTLQYTNHVYQKGITTVILHRSDDELTPPYIDLDANESLTLHFDDMSTDRVRSFNYSLIHCNIDWQPSGLLEMEYLEGFFQGNIRSYDASFNTKQNYINYHVDFPSSDLRITKPGNYILFVYEDNDKSKPILTQRFIAYRQQVSLHYDFKRPGDPNDRNFLQETDVTVTNTGGLRMNRNDDMKVVVLQNNRWDNAVRLNEPKFIRNNELVYDADEGTQFNGGNEFRQLDVRNLNVRSNNVFSLSLDSTIYCAHLYQDERRSSKRYTTFKDANGKFIILRENADDPHYQGDYVWVFFRLAAGENIKDGDVYVYGSYNGWNLEPETKMHYNESTGDYELALKLKQGYYNYMYVVSKDGKSVPDETLLEGTHFDTENDFCVIAYYHDLKSNTDLPVGLVTFNTHNR